MTTSEEKYVLAVEDNPADVRVLERVFEEMDRSIPIHSINTGTQALEFVSSNFGDRQIPPVLVLLDLNLPGTDGRSILKELKTDEVLCSIPVVILTTSNSREDRTWCYETGANSYIVKPNNQELYRRRLQLVQQYWLDAVALPGEGS
ncbi:MAG: response regulator [bacterium]